ncbi:cupin domain-containing protein [Hymenobacter sp. BT491]|nr:cupin domain-containing protein [Hymenobacter sp. BT491]
MSTSLPSKTRRDALHHLTTAALGTGFLGWLPNESAAASQAAPHKTFSSSPLPPFLLPPAAPLQLNTRGIVMRTWVRSSQTNRQYSSVEFLIGPKQMGPPPHVHRDLDEIMFVLSGTVSVLVEETVYTVPAGGWHLRPHGLVHTFWNATDAPAHYVDMYFNQNFEDFLEELNGKILADMEKYKLTPADPGIAKRWADLDRRFGITTFFDQRQPLIDKYGLKA